MSEFTEIQINQSRQVTKGEITAIKGELKIVDVDAVLDSIRQLHDNFFGDDETAEENDSSYTTPDSIIVVLGDEEIIINTDTSYVTEEGDTITTNLGLIPPIIIVNSDTFTVSDDGIVNVDDQGNGDDGNNNNQNSVQDSSYRINYLVFKPLPPIQGRNDYGFDPYDPKIPQYLSEYEQEVVMDSTYLVPWRSIEKGRTGKIEMQIQSLSADSIESRLVVENAQGISLPFTLSERSENDTTLQLRILDFTASMLHEDEQRITAYYKTDDDNKVAVGHLNTVSYEKQAMKLVIVPVDGEWKYSETELKTYLNQIYGTAVTEWDISIVDSLDIFYDENDATGLDTDLPGMAKYSAEMRTINKAMKRLSSFDKKTFYLFLVNKSETGEHKGIMPFRGQFGYIFLNNTTDKTTQFHTIAHELGHGAFALRHNFAEKGTTQGQTPNLMDYSGGTTLRKYQWSLIHNPKSSWFGGDEEDVSSVGNQIVLDIISLIQNSCKYENKELNLSDIYKTNWEHGVNVSADKKIIISDITSLDVYMNLDMILDERDKNVILLTDIKEEVLRKKFLSTNGQCLVLNFKYKNRNGYGLRLSVPMNKGSFFRSYILSPCLNTKSINEYLPEEIKDITQVSTSIQIPGNRIMYKKNDFPEAHLKTIEKSILTLKISQTDFVVEFSSALLFEIDWVEDVFFKSITLVHDKN